MRPGVRVRVATELDVDDLARLADDVAVSGPRVKVAPDRRERYAQLLDAPGRVVLVAVDERTELLVGVVAATEDQVGALVQVRAMLVDHLVVELSHRRKGVGRALLAGIVRTAEERDIERIVVSVANSDRDANRYLARLGFAPLVVRRIAPTATLRRTLGMSELHERSALRRRRVVRAVLPGRAMGRGA